LEGKTFLFPGQSVGANFPNGVWCPNFSEYVIKERAILSWSGIPEQRGLL